MSMRIKLHDLREKVIKILHSENPDWGSTWEPWYENSEGTGSVAVVSATSWMFKKIPF